MKRRSFFFLLLLAQAFSLDGKDTTKVLTIRDFFEIILENHPVARQSSLLDDRAKQELRIARGILDPYLSSSYQQKEFQAKSYYSLWDNYLRIPTWYGIDFKAGYQRNTGPFVNGEDFTPQQGLTYLGISVPIGQGLLIDERRSQIKQAQQLSTIAEAERVKIINKLLLQAAKDYWDWMYSYNKWKLYQEGLTLAANRYDAVRERVKYGDLSAIDTVEAMVQVQNFQILLVQSEVEYKNYSLILSNYLWNENSEPLEITEQIVPSEAGSEVTPLPEDSLQLLVRLAKANHPDLLKLNAKLNQLAIENKFVTDKFKPKVYLDYTLLHGGFPPDPDLLSNTYFGNNYKMGMSFSYPVFLRNERGKLELTKVKIKETKYDLQQAGREIENSIYSSANDWAAIEKQLLFQENLVKNSEMLRAGEQVRFENGESSVFLVNSRETSLISNRIKLYELKAKYAKSKVMLQWASGYIP